MCFFFVIIFRKRILNLKQMPMDDSTQRIPNRKIKNQLNQNIKPSSNALFFVKLFARAYAVPSLNLAV